MKVAILDDYQNVSMILGNFEKLKKDFDFEVFNQSFENEDRAIEKLKDFELMKDTAFFLTLLEVQL
jgi:hypothetical protein